MQFGIFTIGDVTTDPTSGITPSEAERIRNMTEIALKAEEVGLDVLPRASTIIRHSCPPPRLLTWPTSQHKPRTCCFRLRQR